MISGNIILGLSSGFGSRGATLRIRPATMVQKLPATLVPALQETFPGRGGAPSAGAMPTAPSGLSVVGDTVQVPRTRLDSWMTSGNISTAPDCGFGGRA